MNKTFREDPRGAQGRNEDLGGAVEFRRGTKKQKSWLYWPAETRAESPTQIRIPAVIVFFFDQLSSVFCIPLLTCATLSRNRLTQHKANSLLFIPPNYILESPCPPRRQKASRTVRATSRGSMKLQFCALHSQTHEGGLRTQHFGVATAFA